MSQTMLLTKRLTTFLSQNTSPQLPTLLLTSPAGKLLASSSPLPSSQLRTQATLACSLWQLYQPVLQSHDESSHGTSTTSHTRNPSGIASIPTISSDADATDQSSITIQLSEGIMVIRALKCKLLFVAIGAVTLPAHSVNSPMLHAQAQHLSSSSLGSPPVSPSLSYPEGHEGLVVGGYADRDSRKTILASSQSLQGSAAPSEVGSLASTTKKAHTNILLVKRHAEEVGKWLEENLQGFALSSAEGR